VLELVAWDVVRKVEPVRRIAGGIPAARAGGRGDCFARHQSGTWESFRKRPGRRSALMWSTRGRVPQAPQVRWAQQRASPAPPWCSRRDPWWPPRTGCRHEHRQIEPIGASRRALQTGAGQSRNPLSSAPSPRIYARQGARPLEIPGLTEPTSARSPRSTTVLSVNWLWRKARRSLSRPNACVAKTGSSRTTSPSAGHSASWY